MGMRMEMGGDQETQVSMKNGQTHGSHVGAIEADGVEVVFVATSCGMFVSWESSVCVWCQQVLSYERS